MLSRPLTDVIIKPLTHILTIVNGADDTTVEALTAGAEALTAGAEALTAGE